MTYLDERIAVLHEKNWTEAVTAELLVSLDVKIMAMVGDDLRKCFFIAEIRDKHFISNENKRMGWRRK